MTVNELRESLKSKDGDLVVKIRIGDDYYHVMYASPEADFSGEDEDVLTDDNFVIYGID